MGKKGTTKRLCPDLGQFLIYLMISRRTQWHQVAAKFIKEVFTRNVRWMVNDRKYKKYDTIEERKGRSNATFKASTTSRRLVLFQVWFMRNCSTESLQSYNDRLGRPRLSFRNAVLQRTRAILECKHWGQYFDGLGVHRLSEKEMDQLLRFAVGNSVRNGYHGQNGYRSESKFSGNGPKIRVILGSNKNEKSIDSATSSLKSEKTGNAVNRSTNRNVKPVVNPWKRNKSIISRKTNNNGNISGQKQQQQTQSMVKQTIPPRNVQNGQQSRNTVDMTQRTKATK